METLESELRCPVCHEYYKDAVMLTCTHHVCMEHLGNVQEPQRLQCPVCKDVTVVPEEGLQVDRVLQLVVECHAEANRSMRSDTDVTVNPEDRPTCGFCEEQIATRRCVQCAGSLCEECVKTSHSKGFFRNHTIIDLEALTPRASALAPSDTKDVSRFMLCDNHPEEKLNFYCLDCRRPVCSHCLILGEHKGHQQTPIDQAFETGKETLSAWIEKLAQRLAQTDDLLEQLKTAEIELNTNAEAQRTLINNEMDHLRELIETKRGQLLSKSLLEEKQKRTQLQGQMDRAYTGRSEASGLVGRSRGLLGLASEHAFLAVVLPLIQEMKICAGQRLDSSPLVSLTFRPLSTDSQVRSLGDLDLGHPRLPQPTAQAQMSSLPGQREVHMVQSPATVSHQTHHHAAVVHPTYGSHGHSHAAATVGQMSYNLHAQGAQPVAQAGPQPPPPAPMNVMSKVPQQVQQVQYVSYLPAG
eukprot:TRINITY_DN5605_c0_g1_i2.p1 TRINITY_DN5605_c0_g1~~TRINITY_DN5605_c0_g1_i2.p1  ORF type:complete len:469 (-),score=98.38 TRINITY_DN5605_c0_g1_i2:148-1554(-)